MEKAPNHNESVVFEYEFEEGRISKSNFYKI